MNVDTKSLVEAGIILEYLIPLFIGICFVSLVAVCYFIIEVIKMMNDRKYNKKKPINIDVKKEDINKN